MATQKHKPGRYLLLYGSQTGQAQAIAEEIFERSSKHGLQPDLFCMSMFGKKFQVEEEKCVVIVTSTTGDGDPPDTAVKFVRRLNRKILPSDFLSRVSYSVLGLGDTNYSNFCNNAKNVDRRFSELGAQRFYPSGFADDAEGLDVVVDPWMDALFPALQKAVGVCSDSDAQSSGVGDVGTGQSNGTPAPSHSQCSGTAEPDHSQCNGTSPDEADGLLDQPSVTGSSNGETQKTSKPVLLNGSISVDKKLESKDTHTSHTVNDSQSSQTLTNQNVHADIVNTNGLLTHTDQPQILDINVTRKADGPQILENGTSETSNVNNNADADDTPQSEAEDTLELNPPTLDVPSLGASSDGLSERTLTLPAATPVFLTATYLPPDENLISKMAELPWQNGCKPPSAASDIVKAKVVWAERLTAPDAVKKTLLLRLSAKGGGLRYRPGDSISVICTNDDKEVSQLIKRLGLTSQADVPMKLSILPDTKKRRAAVPPHVPEDGVSLRYILKNCLDIRLPPKKALLRHLADCSSQPAERRRLQELCSKEGAEDYTAFVHDEHVSLLDVLYTFPSCHPPVERLIEHLPRLQPRPYSVCSCEEWHPDQLDIAFNVVTIPPSRSRLYARRGVCTGWLDDLTPSLQGYAGKEGADSVESLAQRVESLSLADMEIPIFARTNQHFRTPGDLSVPLVMIGPGTGVAPFIGFLQERQLRLQKEDHGDVGETWLLFGCRHKHRDFLFQSAISQFQQEKVLTKFLPAFSRDPQDSPGDPRYVQDNIRAHASELCRLIDTEEAVVFVCGDAKHMAADVSAAFQDVFTEQLGLSADKAKEYVMTLRIRHRYLEDVWT